jgi:polyisoprenoid-binding protein YceI
VNKKFVCGANVTARLTRSDFGMTALLPALPDEVTLLIQVEAFRQ